MEERHAGRVAGGEEAAVAQAARWEGSTAVMAGRARAERTANMDCMSATLDVSRLSGWLNALAYCQVGKEEGIRGGRAGLEVGGRGAAAQAACCGGPDSRLSAEGTRGAHPKHLVHGCDAGGVPARYVCIERGHAGEERAHVGDC